MILKYKLEYIDYLNWLKFNREHISFYKRKYLIGKYLPIFGFFCVWIIYRDQLSIVKLILAIILYSCICPYAAKFNDKRYIKSVLDVDILKKGIDTTLNITKERLIFENYKGKTEIIISNITSIQEYKNTFFLIINKSDLLMVPFIAFENESDKNKFFKLIENNKKRTHI